MATTFSASKSKTGAKGASGLTAPQLERVLGSGALDGFSPGVARRLIERFGAKAADAIAESDPQAQAILGPRWRHASDEILEHADALPMLSYLMSRGFSGVMARKTMIWQGHESEFPSPEVAMRAWSEDPYRLADIPGISFERADRIALEQGVGPESTQRLLACAREALSASCDNAGGGAKLSDAQSFARKLLAQNDALSPARVAALAQPCLEEAAKVGLAKMAKDEKGQPMVFSADLYEAEEMAAHIMLGMAEQPSPLRVEALEERVAQLEAQTGLTLHDEQRQALATLFEGRVSVICGKPGSGKTTLLQCAAPLLEGGGKKVLYAAPTGKAAKRMSKSLGRHAVTLHRLLAVGKEDKKKGPQKARGAGAAEALANIRDADAVVIDESSMVDSKMFLRLLKALGPQTALILVGDPQQLPSVGAGKVLRDLIDSGRVPTAIMTKVMRQAATSTINLVARSIGDGVWVDFTDKQNDCVFLDAPDARHIATRIAKMLLGNARAKYDPLRDCQVLCAGNQGPAGVHEMNAQLQALLNAPDPGKAQVQVKEGLTLRVGDKVMQMTNDYERELRQDAPALTPGAAPLSAADVDVDALGLEVGVKKGVFNGDVGYVESVAERPSPGKIRVRFEDGVAEYDLKEAGGALALAYACTVHKFQGSEAPLIYFVMHDTCPMMLRTRNLVYTAITRAKEKCLVMGSERALRQAVGKDALASRRTRLKGLIDGSIAVDDTASSEVLARSERQAFNRLVQDKVADLQLSQRDLEFAEPSAPQPPAEEKLEAAEAAEAVGAQPDPPKPRKRRAKSL